MTTPAIRAFRQPTLPSASVARSRARERASALMVTWCVFNVLAGSISLGTGLYVSQITLIAFAVVMLIWTRADLVATRMLASLVVLVVMGLWIVLTNSASNVRFESEAGKTLLLIVPAILMWGHAQWRDLRLIARIVPSAVVLLLATTALLGTGNFYGVDGRFGVPAWGSPNTTAFVISIAMALALFAIQTRRRDKGNPLEEVVHWALFAVLGGFLLVTGSRGGLLSVSVVLLIYLRVPMRGLFLIFVAAILAVPLLGIEVPELAGSGRLLIWQGLVQDLVAGGPQVWLVGYGPGAIYVTPWFTALVQSGHSIYFEVLYYFGLMGLAIVVVALFRFSRQLARADLDSTQRTFVTAVFCSLIVGFSVDSYLMAAQMTWLGAFLLSTGGLLRPARS